MASAAAGRRKPSNQTKTCGARIAHGGRRWPQQGQVSVWPHDAATAQENRSRNVAIKMSSVRAQDFVYRSNALRWIYAIVGSFLPQSTDRRVTSIRKVTVYICITAPLEF
jgi:hypothetical protein